MDSGCPPSPVLTGLTLFHTVGKRWPWTWGGIPPQNFYDCLYIYYACTDNEIPGTQELGGYQTVLSSLICYNKINPNYIGG